MLKRIRKSSSRVSLVLIGAAALTAGLTGCSQDEVRRDVYASKEDCLADWGNTPKDCEPAYDRPTGNAATTHYYGRPYTLGSGSSSSRGIGSSSSRGGSRAIGSSTSSRGGFGSSGRSSVS